ncbi:hypothetical protein [Bacillus litorisediminis]|uniref:hypothetical protein n=1 Tax=Bacillus litorisediminis TaxID=2922713 RepID=UPI001FAE69FD|nr:hypothetical protein [Bacillus litorisediminis]
MDKYWLPVILFFLLILGACNEEEIFFIENQGNPTAEEILSKNKNADIFEYERIIYKNAEEVEWVQDLELEIGKEVTQITKQSQDGKGFTSGTATKLPVGTIIYEPLEKQGLVLIAVVDGQQIRYLGLVEG